MNDINDIYVFVYDGEIPLSKALTDEVTKAEWMAREEIVSLWQRCLIDEAANIGQIPNLEKLKATIRSREIF